MKDNIAIYIVHNCRLFSHKLDSEFHYGTPTYNLIVGKPKTSFKTKR